MFNPLHEALAQNPPPDSRLVVGRISGWTAEPLPPPRRILVCGPGRAGKDTALDYLASITTLRNAGSTSKYITPYAAGQLGISEAEAYRRRNESDEMRERWRQLGDEYRRDDPALFVRMALRHGDMTGGCRTVEEIEAVRAEHLVDLIVWINNPRVPHDPSLKFSIEAADVIIPNHWSLPEFEQRLRRFSWFAGLPMRGEP